MSCPFNSSSLTTAIDYAKGALVGNSQGIFPLINMAAVNPSQSCKLIAATLIRVYLGNGTDQIIDFKHSIFIVLPFPRSLFAPCC